MKRTRTATGRFTVTGWDEKIITDIDGTGTERHGVYYPRRGLTRADSSYAYSGAIDGTGHVSYLISYRDGAAPISGFERFEGSVDGHDGSFVLRHTGEHDAEGVRATLEIVEGLGTGGLAHIRGEATVDLVGHSESGYPITLTYDLEPPR